jgi:hypothetical protein
LHEPNLSGSEPDFTAIFSMENIASSRLAIISIQKVDSRQKSEYLEFFGEEGQRGLYSCLY